MSGQPIISAWSAVSPFGIGRAEFGAGLRAGTQTGVVLDKTEWNVPDDKACLVPGFDIRGVLGKKGTRSMDRVSGLAVTAVRELLADRPDEPPTGEGAALVLGTTTGSAQSMMDFSRDSFVQDRPWLVDTARFPNAVMNCAAGQCAIWHQLKGPNATVAGGRVAGLYALNYARRLLASQRAKTVLCGAVEEYSSARAWLEHHSRPVDENSTLAGEGCAMLLVEPANTAQGPGLAEVLAVEFGVFAEGSVKAALTACVRRALRRAEVDAADVWAVAPSEAPGLTGMQENEALVDLFGDMSSVQVVRIGAIGDTAAAAAAFQVVALLSLAAETPASGRVAMVTSVDRTGVVGCALLRLR